MIDGHIHFWDPDRFRYDWLSGRLATTFLPADVPFASAGVTGAVFVEASAEPRQALAEARWASLLGPAVAGIVAFAALEEGDAIGDQLDTLVEIPQLCGVRRSLQDEPGDFFERDALAQGLHAVESRALSFDACVRWDQVSDLARLLARVDGLTVILDHLGKPPVAAGFDSMEAGEWERSIRLLARNEAVSVKLSGLAPEAGECTDLRAAARPFLDVALDAFGPERCLAASDWPVSAVAPAAVDYPSWFSIALEGLSEPEARAVGTETATRVYRLHWKE